MRVDLSDDKAKNLKSSVLTSEYSILPASGGHSIEMLKDSKIIEVKQGLYSGLDDKDFF